MHKEIMGVVISVKKQWWFLITGASHTGKNCTCAKTARSI